MDIFDDVESGFLLEFTAQRRFRHIKFPDNIPDLQWAVKIQADVLNYCFNQRRISCVDKIVHQLCKVDDRTVSDIKYIQKFSLFL